jgi:hypothetical protein
MAVGRRVVAALLVPMGVAVAHAVAYALAHPDGGDRARALGSVHAHLGPLVAVGVVSAAAAVAGAVRAGTAGTPLGLGPGRIAAAQVAAFAAMEVAERLAGGEGWRAAFHEPAVWVGLVVQALVGLAAWVVVRAGERVGVRLARRRPRADTAPCACPAPAHEPAPAVPLTALSRRGPPLAPVA